MIRRVYSDLPKFKSLDFHSGLNVLLAEKSKGATDKHTRNRAGKSSLLDVMHFALGSSCRPDSIFRNDALRDAVFGMEFDLAGEFVRVERSGAKSTPVNVFGDFSRWPLQPTVKGDIGALSNDNWTAVLGRMMFGLEDFEGSWAPSFRSLISYFVRRERVGGMTQPMMQSRKQATADQQVNISFLLGLDWTVPREWQRVREREKALEQLKKSMKDGAFGAMIGSASQIQSELFIAQDRTKRLRSSVASFRVHDQYHELEREASSATARITEISDDNLVDQRYIAELESATETEIPPVSDDLEALFREVGIVLPELVKRRFEEAAQFHASIVSNRRQYLESELSAARRRVEERNKEKDVVDRRRAEVMTVLQSAGALEHFDALRAQLTKEETNVEALRQRYDAAESLESGDLRLKMERGVLLERLRRDYTEQIDTIQDAVLTFSRISSQLYENDKAGALTISPTDDGPAFEPHIPGEKSRGVNNMRIFCFDMTLMLLSLQRGRSPGFLVHDSHIFDGVDDRQVGKALAVGATLAKTHGFQYIVTMNTDDVPREIPTGFDLATHVLPVRLTDASEDGGLFGLRFD